MNVRGRIKGSRYYIHSKKSRIEAGENEGLDGVTDARGWDTGTLVDLSKRQSAGNYWCHPPRKAYFEPPRPYKPCRSGLILFIQPSHPRENL